MIEEINAYASLDIPYPRGPQQLVLTSVFVVRLESTKALLDQVIVLLAQLEHTVLREVPVVWFATKVRSLLKVHQNAMHVPRDVTLGME